jgi:hypothetical protein
MADNSPPDLPRARSLVRLQFALEHAVRLARDLSEPGAHIAIVALDGAVEHALWLVERAYGAQLPQDARRDQLVRRVHEALANARGEPWEPAGADSVDQLHRARNDAQHAALRFDTSQLPDWSTAAQAFIDGLITAAFGHALSDVTLADTVREPALTDLMRRAERDIDRDEPDAGAFLLICAAFDEARRRWRDQLGHAHGQATAELALLAQRPAMGMLDPVVRQEDRLADFLEVAPFAGDLGEYTSFLAARRQQQSGWTPEPADTRRALLFVGGWIVRWEVFNLGYPLERWEAHLESLAPPVVGDGSKTEIIEHQAFLSAEFPGHPARCHLVFTLANIPDRGRGPWGNWLHKALIDANAELRENVRFDGVQLSLTGRLLLVCDLGYSADAIASVVKRAVELTNERYRDWSQNEARRRIELRRIQEAFTQAIVSARQSRAVFDTVEVTERPTDGQPVVWQGLNFGESKFDELGLCTQGFQNAGSVLAGAGTLREQIVFDAFELTPENEALLRRTVQLCEETVLERRAYYNRRVLEFQHFQNRLGELFS